MSGGYPFNQRKNKMKYTTGIPVAVAYLFLRLVSFSQFDSIVISLLFGIYWSLNEK